MSRRMLGPFVLAMISIAAIVDLRDLPFMASVGLSSVFFYVLAALLFLIPSSLICAELASTWPQAGGIYLWVRKAFGDKTGFLSIWLEWINNVISFPASLSFMAATIAYLFKPNLAQNNIYLFSVIFLILWGTTLFNLLGIKASSRLNVVGALSGAIIPGIAIILLGAFWIMSGKVSQINFSVHNIFPAFHMSNWVFFAGVLSGYSGIQLIAFHAQNVEHPKKTFPRAILMAVAIILCVTILASLAIAVVVPNQSLNLVSGLMQGFSGFFQAFHIPWGAVDAMVFLILIGALSSLSAWLLGPARGLQTSAKNGQFFHYFAKENKNEAPSRILIMQAIIASVMSLVFFWMPNSSTAFWVLIDLSSQSTLLMYILIFSAAIYLRYKEPSAARPFKIGGGNIGMWIVAGAGALVCLGALCSGFFPPSQLKTGALWRYEGILIVVLLLNICVPYVISKISKGKLIS